jgi:SAM-dependent methyltransferase
MTSRRDRYDTIGRSYSRTRREDPRIATAVHEALGSAASVLNVGAGSGNYEPTDRPVVAVEPSVEMLRQRRDGSAPAVRAVAESLPFPTVSFDAAMAFLTVHHWTDPAAGLRELERVSLRQVVFFFEALKTHDFWALEYFPSAIHLPTEVDPPGEAFLAEHLPIRHVERVLVPSDCQDGFGAAFWARPDAYLDPDVQAGMSWLAMLPENERRHGTAQLRSDLESGAWDDRHGHLRELPEYDGGYRIAIAYR